MHSSPSEGSYLSFWYSSSWLSSFSWAVKFHPATINTTCWTLSGPDRPIWNQTGRPCLVTSQAHLCPLPSRQRRDVTEVCDAAQLAGHGHHSSFPGILRTFGHAETDHHGLLIIFPAKWQRHEFKPVLILFFKNQPSSVRVKKYLCSSSRLSRSVWKSRFSRISSGASLYCCLSSWITELLSAARRWRSAWAFFLSASVMSPSSQMIWVLCWGIGSKSINFQLRVI